MAFITKKNVDFGLKVLLRRSLCISSTKNKKVMSDPIDHATGPEKSELLAKAAGNENPFNMRVFKRTNGELSNPTAVPSFNESRLVGCICQEDATTINWMWLTKGDSKRCECGYFFKLVDAKPMV